MHKVYINTMHKVKTNIFCTMHKVYKIKKEETAIEQLLKKSLKSLNRYDILEIEREAIEAATLYNGNYTVTNGKPSLFPVVAAISFP